MSADRVSEAMQEIDRRGFLRLRTRRMAGADRPLPIGLGQTNSQPRTVARMLRLLDPQPGHRVLDVGAGSGWTTALLARLVGDRGEVIGVELEPRLAIWGDANVARAGFGPGLVRAALPGVLGWPDGAPYDRVLVSAAATTLPIELVAQLAAPGVMVCVVQTTLIRIDRDDSGKTDASEHGSYSFVPLRSAPGSAD